MVSIGNPDSDCLVSISVYCQACRLWSRRKYMTPGSTFPLPLSEGDSQDRGHQTEGSPRAHGVSDFETCTRSQKSG